MNLKPPISGDSVSVGLGRRNEGKGEKGDYASSVDSTPDGTSVRFGEKYERN